MGHALLPQRSFQGYYLHNGEKIKMNPSHALKQKIEAMAKTMEMQWRAFSTDDSGACIEKPSDVFIEAYECGAQSLVPLVESLVKVVESRQCVQYVTLGVECRPNQTEKCVRCEALTNYRKFIGG